MITDVVNKAKCGFTAKSVHRCGTDRRGGLEGAPEWQCARSEAAGGFGRLQGAVLDAPVLDAPVLPVQTPLCPKEQKDTKSSVLSLRCGLFQRFPPALAWALPPPHGLRLSLVTSQAPFPVSALEGLIFPSFSPHRHHFPSELPLKPLRCHFPLSYPSWTPRSPRSFPRPCECTAPEAAAAATERR